MTRKAIKAKETLTALELDHGDQVDFTLRSGQVVHLELISTDARVIRTNLKVLKVEQNRARTLYRFRYKVHNIHYRV